MDGRKEVREVVRKGREGWKERSNGGGEEEKEARREEMMGE